MTQLFKPFTAALSALTLAVALGQPLAAQESTTEDAPTAEADSGFDMGQEVDENGNPIAAEPQVGQQYLREEFDDWAMRCLKVEEGEDPCQMYQLLSTDEGADVAEVAIVRLEAGGQAVAGATIVVPLETLLTEQLTLRVDGGTARRFAFSFCNPGGCVARVGLTQQDIDLFRRGNAATLRMVPASAPDEEVVVTMSLSGFTAAYDAVAP